MYTDVSLNVGNILTEGLKDVEIISEWEKLM